MKSSLTHTEDPWRVMVDPADSRLKVVTEDGACAICTINPVLMAYESNARLIAAAPELLEACKELLARQVCPLGQSKADRWSVACDMARAAIAKAEGNI